MKQQPWIVIVGLMLVINRAYSSQETNLEVATEMTCEQLLYQATTLYGSLNDIEYAVSFAIEERSAISRLYSASRRDPELLAELKEINLKAARAVAAHRLFQKPKCPIDSDWYDYNPTEVGINSLWD